MRDPKAADTTVGLIEKMGTPSRLGQTIGKDFLGSRYRVYPWVSYVESRVLEAVTDPEPRFIILNVPPQSGKTTFSGLLLPSWYLGMYPHHQVFFIAYAQEYAESWGVKCRNLLTRYGRELFGVGMSKSQAAGGNWKTTGDIGGMVSVGIDGQITGRPGNLIVIDDVISTMEDASSSTKKRKHLEQYDGAISSRFQEGSIDEEDGSVVPGTTVVVTATRFAEDDLSGRLIERMDKAGYAGDKWEVISIPALASPPEDLEGEALEEWRDFLGRRAGEGLHGRYSQRFYEQRRASIDPYVFSALYQQDPSVRAGGMFPKPMWRYWNDTNLPNLVRTVRVWDLASTEGGGDWTVGSKFALGADGDLYLLAREREQLGPDKVQELVKATAAADGFEVKILIEQEKAGAGKALVEVYKTLLAGYNVAPAKIDGSKEVRATPYSAMQRVGRVHLPEADEKLCEEWKTEHAKMMGDGRRPRHDDQIDTGAYATLDLLGEGVTSLWIPGEDPEDLGSAMLASFGGGQMGRFG